MNSNSGAMHCTIEMVAHDWSRVRLLAESGRLFVNDVNDDAAPAATVLNLRAGFEQQVARWQLKEWLRVDNAADRSYAGSVIVNEGTTAALGGGRYFEPALPRNWWVGLTARYSFE